MSLLSKYIFIFAAALSISGCAGYKGSFEAANMDAAGLSESAKSEDLSADASDSLLIASAKREILDSRESGSRETACSIFVFNVLERAGFQLAPFTANGFSDLAEKALPNWDMAEFAMTDSARGRDALQAHLNAQPDKSAIVAQWPRAGRSGHIAIVEKVSHDQFVIYQAQQGRTRPHSKETSVEFLMYSKNQWGDRSRVRIYSAPNAMALGRPAPIVTKNSQEDLRVSIP